MVSLWWCVIYNLREKYQIADTKNYWQPLCLLFPGSYNRVFEVDYYIKQVLETHLPYPSHVSGTPEGRRRIRA